MNRFDNIPFYDDETEFGEVKKKAVAVKKVPVKKPIAASFFRQAVIRQGQSQNVEDVRTVNPNYAGTRLVQIWGYFTRNTWWHLASRVPQDIIAALQSRNIGVIYANADARDSKNSQYNFGVNLRVFNQYNTNQAVNSVVFTLGQTIAFSNSIRIIRVVDYKK